MNQLGFFDFDIRLSRIDKAGDPLVKLNKAVDQEIFRPVLEEAKKKPKAEAKAKTAAKPKAAAKPKTTAKKTQPKDKKE